MKKRILKATAKASGIFFLVCAVYLLLLAHPGPLFSCSVTYSNITFCSHSPLSPQIANLASAINQRLSTSELYDPAVKQRVFIVDQSWLWTLLNGPYRGAIARNVEIGNPTLVPHLDVERQVITHFDGRHAGALNILTHEAIHTLVKRRIGLLRLWRLQWWQREGYPEYIASARATHSEAPREYQDAAGAWKYLLEQRHLSFDQVVKLQDSSR
jgi:hypothetical protein